MVLREGSFFAAGQAFGVQRVQSSLIRQWAGFGGSKRFFFYFYVKTPNPCPLYVYDVTLYSYVALLVVLDVSGFLISIHSFDSLFLH